MQCCLLCRRRKGPRAKESGLPLEAGKGKEWTVPWSLQKAGSPAR